jgi:hypothetical protein
LEIAVSFPLAPASEFPNDNPALHQGALWVSETPCGLLAAVRLVPDEDAKRLVADDDDNGDDIEIVDDLDAIAYDIDEADAREIVMSEDAESEDAPFSIYVRTLTDVLIAAGGSDAAGALAATLADEPTARAWRRIISGESEDFTACGTKSLDEWSAELVARLIAMPAKTDQLRRELRSRGVAAFGIIV